MKRIYLGLDTGQQPVSVSREDSIRHSAVIGQSGSGKSYFLARLLEEIVLNTQARIVILDPNGDFARFDEPASTVWDTPPFDARLRELATSGSSADDQEQFDQLWNRRTFQHVSDEHPIQSRRSDDPLDHLVPEDPIPEQTTGGREGRRDRFRLLVHWKYLAEEQQFLLGLDPEKSPGIYLAYELCMRQLTSRLYTDEYAQGFGIWEIRDQALEYVRNRELRLSGLESSLIEDADFLALVGLLDRVSQRYEILYTHELKGKDFAPVDLAGFIRRPPRHKKAAQVSVVGLGASSADDTLLAADVLLRTLLRTAVREKRRSLERPHGAPDLRVPTLLVIDEAHRFAPADPHGRLHERVSDRIAQVAAEGRKYGLFILVSTQRPAKLRPGLLDECENACILRLQSEPDRAAVGESFSVPPQTLEEVRRLNVGSGLLCGRWVPSSIAVRLAPARTVLGGGGLDVEWWTMTPEEAAEREPLTEDSEELPGDASDAAEPELESDPSVDPLEATRAFLAQVAEDDERRRYLRSEGIRLERLAPMLREHVGPLDPGRWGFSKFRELLQGICAGTPYCLYYLPPYEVRLGERKYPLEDMEPLPDLASRQIHSTDTYRRILASGSTGRAPIRVPSLEVLNVVATGLVQAARTSAPLSDILGDLYRCVPLETEETRACALTFAFAGCLDRQPPEARMSDATFSVPESIGSADSLVASLKEKARERLRQVLGADVNEESLEGVFATSETPNGETVNEEE